ncbi:hypothetical protein GWI33_002522 [Rhynchophorus ferrugineus]|uniref:Uncharacterized protein n=1 Tax=Rhynchophorus ferrugineus TaxID=354439 RepID=A0A834IW02_RHYFE|nr:hypothetical protein GWI33_002522 [Rhynchophorus ferrugineus]
MNDSTLTFVRSNGTRTSAAVVDRSGASSHGNEKKGTLVYLRNQRSCQVKVRPAIEMLILPFLVSIQSVEARGDTAGTYYKSNTTHLDIFMMLFLLCTLEVVVIKILTYEEENEMHGTQSSRRRSPMAMFFDRD